MLKTLGAFNGQILGAGFYSTIPLLIMISFINYLGFCVSKKSLDLSNSIQELYVASVPVDLNPVYILGISIEFLRISAFASYFAKLSISKISPVKAIKYN